MYRLKVRQHIDEANKLAGQLEALIDSIRAGKPIVELRETAKSSLTAVMGRMAAYTGQRVTWDFVTKESSLDLFPKELDWNGSRPAATFAIPGTSGLV